MSSAIEEKTRHWRQSFWTKMIAACFIGLIVLGNIWLVLSFQSQIAPIWLQNAFVTLVASVFVFGAALGAEQIMRKIGDADSRQTEREKQDDDPK